MSATSAKFTTTVSRTDCAPRTTWSDTSDRLAKESNTTLNTAPVPIAADSSPCPITIGAQNQTLVTFNLSTTCPLPEGHHHVVLKDPLNTVPLISYLALQSTRTLCYMGAGSQCGSYAVLLNQVTGIETVYFNETPGPRAKVAMQDFKLRPRAIMLRPADDGWSAGFVKSLADCVIYCGVPKNIDQFEADCLLKTKYSYLIILSSQFSTLIGHNSPRSSQHPSSNYFNDEREDSVLHKLRLKTGTVLESLDAPPISVGPYKALLSSQQASTYHISGPSSSDPVPLASGTTDKQLKPMPASGLTAVGLTAVKPESGALGLDGKALKVSPRPLARPLLEGHYCIPLDRPVDAVPLICYLALRSTRTLCFLTIDDPWEAYQVLVSPPLTNVLQVHEINNLPGLFELNRITGIKTLYWEGNDMKRIASEIPSVMMLRPANDSWNSGFSESLADCVIYWGVPNKPVKFKRSCELRARHSYIIMSRSQFADQSIRRFPGDCFWPHPSLSLFNDQTRNSALQELRLKMGHIRATMAKPPASAGEPKDLLSGQGTPSAKKSVPSDGVMPGGQTSNRAKMASERDFKIEGSSASLHSKTEPFDLQKTVRARRVLSPGLNYVELEQDMDETSVSVYFALMSNKTICVVREQEGFRLRDYAQMFNSVAKFNVLYLEDVSRTRPKSIKRAFRAFNLASSPAVLLLAHDASQILSFKSAYPDCIVYWGLPLSVSNYVSQISSLQRPVRSCLILPRQQSVSRLEVQRWRLSNCGIVQYPDTVLQNSFGPASAYQIVRKVSSQVLEAMSTSPGTKAEDSNSAAYNTIQSSSGTQGVRSMPLGHYYVVLGLAPDFDIIPLMAHVALRSEKTIFCLPSNRLRALQGAFKEATKLTVAICGSSKTKEIEKSINQFKSQNYRVLIRPADMKWTKFLRDSPIESLVYLGVPPNIDEYIKECSWRVSHSCLIVTTAQYRQLLSQQSSSIFPLERHPSLQQLHNDREDNLRRGLNTQTPSRF